MRTSRSGSGVAVAFAAVLSLTLGACGGGGGSGAGDNANGTSAKVDANTVVVKGVPTLSELSKGSFTKPPTSSPPGAKGKTIWWISCGQASPSCSQPAADAAQAAKLLGMNFKIADGRFNTSGGYAEAVRTAVAAKPDAILGYGTPCTIAKSAFQDAKNAGILVLGVEAPDCADTEQGGPKLFGASEKYSAKYPDIQTYWRGFGAAAADYIIDASNGKAKLIMSKGTDVGILDWVTKGFEDEFAKCSSCKVVGTVEYQAATLIPDGAWIKGFRAALVKSPNATAAYMPWDVMAGTLGGAKAVQESGLKLDAFGGQGASDGMDAARKDLYTVASARPGGWSAYAAMDTVNRLLQGMPPVDEGTGFQYLDPSLGLGQAGSAYDGSFDYRSAYKKAWAQQ